MFKYNRLIMNYPSCSEKSYCRRCIHTWRYNINFSFGQFRRTEYWNIKSVIFLSVYTYLGLNINKTLNWLLKHIEWQWFCPFSHRWISSGGCLSGSVFNVQQGYYILDLSVVNTVWKRSKWPGGFLMILHIVYVASSGQLVS